MSKRQGGAINGWFLISYKNSNILTVGGWVQGDGKWGSGRSLRTSQVVALGPDQVETLNTIYTLGTMDASNGNRSEWEQAQQEYTGNGYTVTPRNKTP